MIDDIIWYKKFIDIRKNNFWISLIWFSKVALSYTMLKFEVWTLLVNIISLTEWKRLRLSIDIDDYSTKDGLKLFII